MSNALAIALHALAEVTADGAAAQADISTLRSAARLKLDVTHLAGTATVYVETSADAAAWRTAKTIAITAEQLGTELVVGGLQRYVRARWVLVGTTPACMFGLAGDAHVIYCTPRSIVGRNVSKKALADLSDDDKLEACLLGSSRADDYIASAFTLPLTGWPDSLDYNTAALGVAQLFRLRGADPLGPDKTVFDAESDAVRWFEGVAGGRIKPAGMIDSTPDEYEGGAVVESRPARGWR